LTFASDYGILLVQVDGEPRSRSNTDRPIKERQID